MVLLLCSVWLHCSEFRLVYVYGDDFYLWCCYRYGSRNLKFCVYFWLNLIMSSKNSKDESKPIKVNKWDGAAVKNALDDAVKEVLTKKFNYVENFALMDGRLVLCGLAVSVAMFALLWDWLNPFPLSRPILIVCVSLYFIIMGLLTLYTTYKEKGIFVVSIQKDPAGFTPDKTWEASSYLQKYDDKYKLVLSCRDSKTGAVREAFLKKSVANFIDENGTIVYDLIEPEVSKLHNSISQDRKDK